MVAKTGTQSHWERWLEMEGVLLENKEETVVISMEVSPRIPGGTCASMRCDAKRENPIPHRSNNGTAGQQRMYRH